MWSLVVVVLVWLYLQVRWRRSGRPWREAAVLDVAHAYVSLWHRWAQIGRSSLPGSGPAIVVANHTCSADPTFLQAATPRLLSYLTAREHYNVHPLVRRLLEFLGCVPVTRDGRDGTAARKALRRLAAGRVVCLFPEGNLSGVARNRLRPGKYGAAFLALCSRAPVYPAYIAGGPRTERLVRSWVLPSAKAVRVRFGPAIDLSAYYDRPRNRKLLAEVTNLFMQRIRELNKSPG
jgi:1-acyl-sn-glycerol-3-phosphate acyltransferase